MDNFKIALGVSREQSMHKQHAQGKARPAMHCIRLVSSYSLGSPLPWRCDCELGCQPDTGDTKLVTFCAYPLPSSDPLPRLYLVQGFA